ncbi:MAG: ACT domain-containing protein [Deltaproteobacteria bacterium]|nr:ACT domain-containing protein [Deltaproteobacteria bacterium]MBT5486736.1 ACT domain-containing protein [Deltaproteobacteria bacterium]
MDSTKIVLSILEETYIIHKLDQSTNLPEGLTECEFYSLSNSREELSLVCPEQILIQSENSSPNWKCLKVAGPLDLKLTGILAGLSDTLEKAKISIFAISTFETDYLLIQKQVLETAKNALKSAGYKFI